MQLWKSGVNLEVQQHDTKSLLLNKQDDNELLYFLIILVLVKRQGIHFPHQNVIVYCNGILLKDIQLEKLTPEIHVCLTEQGTFHVVRNSSKE